MIGVTVYRSDRTLSCGRSGNDLHQSLYHLRHLDGEDLAALVADLYAARGYGTTREGGLVRATTSGETLRVWVPRAAGTARPDRPVDAVVTLDGRARDHADARQLDAAALAEMLVYAVDRSVARALCDRHLNAPPGDLAPPPWTRARRGLRNVADGRTRVAFVGVALLVLAAALGAVGWVLAGTAPAEDDPAEAATDPGSDVPQIGSTPVATADYGTPATGDSGATPAGDSEASILADDELPPGVTEAGITDLDALAAAHDHVASNRSHTLYLDRYPLRAAPNGSRVQHDVTVTAAGGEYLVTMDTVDSPTRHLGAVYHD